jgi:NADP-dependent 3-hydroxy acid dehydrogenase YdfG
VALLDLLDDVGTTGAALADRTGRRVVGQRVDVTDDASVAAGIAEVLREAETIDVLVNNAGYLCAGSVEEIEAPAK